MFSAGLSPYPQRFRDCAEVYKSGHNISGVYHIYIGDMTEPTKVWDVFFHKYDVPGVMLAIVYNMYRMQMCKKIETEMKHTYW